MDNITVIGGGYSALVAKLLINKKFNSYTLKKQQYKNISRRSNLEINKLLSKKAYSYGSISYKLIHSKMHDRLIFGGNSKIWGGFYEKKVSTEKIEAAFDLNQIKLTPISLNTTGTVSNSSNIVQLQSLSSKILDASKHLENFSEGYLRKFKVEDDIIKLYIVTNGSEVVKITKKLVLCLGTVQLLDVLKRSEFLYDNDIIKLKEYPVKYKIKFTFNGNFFEKKLKNDFVIRYSLIRAFLHWIGFQGYPSILKILSFLPIFVEQHFIDKEQLVSFILQNSSFYENNTENKFNNLFGKSIHYCNLTVNNTNINELLFKISPNIVGLGMAFVKQKKPAPISSDILIDANSKLIKLMSKY